MARQEHHPFEWSTAYFVTFVFTQGPSVRASVTIAGMS